MENSALKRHQTDEGGTGDVHRIGKHMRLDDGDGWDHKLYSGTTLKPESQHSDNSYSETTKQHIKPGPSNVISQSPSCDKNHSQSTLSFDSQKTEENSDGDAPELEFKANSPRLAQKGNSERVDVEANSDSEKTSSMKKIASVHADALKISSLLGRADVVSLYERLKAIRSDPNRVESVTNEILEEGEKQVVVPERKEVAKGSRLSDNDTTAGPSSSPADAKSIVSDISAVIKEMKAKHPDFNMDPSEIYLRLESVMHLPERVQNVVSTLLQEEKEKECNNPSKEDGIFQQVQEVLLQYPNADANRVFNLLEVFAEEPDCIKKVIEHLTKTAAEEKTNNTTLVRKDSFKNDPLYKDMQKLAKIFPDRTEGEIYAHLEVYHDKVNRIELVTEEFLGIGASQGDSGGARNLTKPSYDSADHDEVDGGASTSECSDLILLKFKQDIDILKAVFPDCDQKFLIQQLQDHFEFKGRVDMVTAILMNKKDYPKVKTLSKSQQLRQRLEKLSLDIPEFLKMFPNPREVFYDETKEMDKLYKDHTKLQLLTDFKAWKKKYLKKKLKNHNYHYLPTLREIQTDMLIMGPEMQYYMADEDRHKGEKEWPEEVDEFFYRELLYAKNEEKIESHIKRTKEARERRFQLALQNDDIQQCQCCFDDEVLPEDMSACSAGHVFCNECLVRSVESALTEGKARYPCLTGTCGTEYPLSLLQAVLPSKSFSHVLRRTQEEELRQANIPDLVACPFCPYATVMPDENDKVLRCLNPDCLKESCRLCKEPNHIPLRCDEIEKSDEIKMRTFIENKMAEAMMRTCPDCEKRFYKTEGCNKMTCTCGASMCYVCRQPIDDYEHFNNNNKCNEGHMDRLHNREAEAAAVQAREDYLKEHPELAGITLKHNPMKDVGTAGTVTQANYNDYGEHDDDEDNDDYEDEDDGESLVEEPSTDDDW